ncbi:uncharacterized protein METZ01_LOCUS146482, partial [marine metagenome]
MFNRSLRHDRCQGRFFHETLNFLVKGNQRFPSWTALLNPANLLVMGAFNQVEGIVGDVDDVDQCDGVCG